LYHSTDRNDAIAYELLVGIVTIAISRNCCEIKRDIGQQSRSFHILFYTEKNVCEYFYAALLTTEQPDTQPTQRCQ